MKNLKGKQLHHESMGMDLSISRKPVLEIADKIYERHTFLTGWLTAIGVDPASSSR